MTPCAPRGVPGRMRPLPVHGWPRGGMIRGLTVRMQLLCFRSCAPVTRGRWGIQVLALIALLIHVAVTRRASLCLPRRAVEGFDLGLVVVGRIE